MVPILKGVGWATLEWAVIALIFMPPFVLALRRAKYRPAAMKTAIFWVILLVAALAMIDFRKSFGEAFAGGVDPYRRVTWILLTTVAVGGALAVTRRKGGWRGVRPP